MSNDSVGEIRVLAADVPIHQVRYFNTAVASGWQMKLARQRAEDKSWGWIVYCS